MKNGLFPNDWFYYLKSVMTSPQFRSLKSFIIQEREKYTIFPPKEDIFRAFIETPFDNVKVVILGQDPYHGRGQAHGLAFSVKKGVAIPPSLQNIFIELQNDLGIEPPHHGDLTQWANRGVLLLNTVLTVREGQAHSHRGKGWELFTDEVIRTISREKNGVVFILWGRPAGEKRNLIDGSKHLILQAPHPSPLSAFRGFFGSAPFSKTNRYLESVGKTPINWKID
ncbi:MAG TPA: uracil-DNA glycosylase [Campylobacterales bacterium]|nr:uracil-DNA glycosylase [Campylobacterales bacterium]